MNDKFVRKFVTVVVASLTISSLSRLQLGSHSAGNGMCCVKSACLRDKTRNGSFCNFLFFLVKTALEAPPRTSHSRSE